MEIVPSGDQTIGINLQANQNLSTEFGKAAEATRAETGELQKLNVANQQVNEGFGNLIKQMQAAGASSAEIRGALSGLGVSAEEIKAALGGATEALAKETTAEQLKVGVAKEEAAAIKTSADTYNFYTNIVNNAAAANTKSGTSMQSVGGIAREVRFGVAALTAEMGLAALASGQQLPESLRAGAKGLQEVLDLTVAGLFAFGPWGAAVGAGTGLVVALATGLNTVDPGLASLNKELDNLAAKDATLEALKKLDDISTKDAESLLKAAKASPEFAQKLDDLEKSLQAVNPLLAATDTLMKDLTGSVHGFSDWLGEAGHNLQQVVVLGESGAAGFSAFIGALKEGKSVTDAYSAGNQAAVGVIRSFLEAQAPIIPQQQKVNELLYEADQINSKATDSLKELTDAETKYGDALASANDRLAQLNARTGNERAQAAQSANDAAANAERSYSETVANDQQQLSDKLIALAQSTGDAIANAWQTLSDKESDIAQTLADKESNISQQLADKEQQIAQAEGDKEQQIAQTLADKETDLAYKRQQDFASINAAEIKARSDLAQKILDIDAKEIQDLRDLDAKTHDDLTAAKTEHEADAIEKRAFQERLAIQRNAETARNNATQTAADVIKQEEAKRKAVDETYAHDLALAKRAASEAIAQARQTAAEQTQAAQKAYAEQLADAKRTANEQTAAAQRAYNEQVAAAQKKEAEQTAAAQKAYAEQLAAAKQTEADKLADAQRAYAERTKAITQTYEIERAQIQQTLDLALFAFNLIIQRINLANQSLVGFGKGVQTFIDDPLGLKKSGLIPTVAPGGASSSAGGSGGIGGIGNSPILNSGTRGFSSTGASGGSNTNNTSNVIINIHDATDPIKVGQVVEGIIRRESRR